MSTETPQEKQNNLVEQGKQDLTRRILMLLDLADQEPRDATATERIIREVCQEIISHGE